MPTVSEPVLKSRTAPGFKEAEGDWLCAWCLNRVANEQDRFKFNGQDEFSFSNPDGIRFEIITFSQAVGCTSSGTPTVEHTWFAGHAWSFCLCDSCGKQLGWHYAGKYDFVGLIKTRLVRALLLRN
jgi:hypothetical protein